MPPALVAPISSKSCCATVPIRTWWTRRAKRRWTRRVSGAKRTTGKLYKYCILRAIMWRAPCPSQTRHWQSEIGNSKLIEKITLPITIGYWHYSRIRVIGNVVDSITEPRKKTITISFYNDIQKIQFCWYSQTSLIMHYFHPETCYSEKMSLLPYFL